MENKLTLKDVTEKMSQACFELGRAHFEMELKQQEINDISIRFRNLNIQAMKLNEKISKEPVEVVLPEPSADVV